VRPHALARCSKPRILFLRMNRGTAWLLFSVVSFLGCGARTGTSDFESGGPDDNGGTPNVGASGGSGATDGGFGASGGTPLGGGAPNIAGAASFAGFPSVGGAASFAGFPSVGGAASFAGFPSVGGAASFAGAAGGPGGSGGEGGLIVNACMAIANNACDKCLCTSCSTQVVGCFSSSQCTNIFSCVVHTGCKGLDCVVTCRNIIQNNGGLTGPALSEVFSLATCATQSQANCGCN
jgi:hypothetical protein